jgi:Family of unknown function (DUF6338)
VSEIFKVFEPAGRVAIPQMLAFALLVLPGFIALRVYDMLRGGEGRQAKDVLIDILMYSMASDSVVYAASLLMSSIVPASAHHPWITVVSVWLFLVVPIVLAAAGFELQRAVMRFGIVPDTLTTSWSHMMNRIASQRLEAGAIVTMRDGRVVGARIGQSCRSASTPDDLLLDEVWTIDESRATLVKPSPRSCGVLISRADCQMIEFVRLDGIAAASEPPPEVP